MSPRTGRRPGASDTRGQILDAARRRFAAEGYSAATIRSIATDAEVDAALVHHYFGTKAQLFTAALELPVDPGQVTSALLAGPTDEVGRRLVRTFLGVWDSPTGRHHMRALVRAAATEAEAARMLREFLIDGLLSPVAESLGGDRPRLRAGLVGSQMVGLAFLRYVVELDVLTDADHDAIEAALAPTVQRYLTGQV